MVKMTLKCQLGWSEVGPFGRFYVARTVPQVGSGAVMRAAINLHCGFQGPPSSPLILAESIASHSETKRRTVPEGSRQVAPEAGVSLAAEGAQPGLARCGRDSRGAPGGTPPRTELRRSQSGLRPIGGHGRAGLWTERGCGASQARREAPDTGYNRSVFFRLATAAQTLKALGRV